MRRRKKGEAEHARSRRPVKKLKAVAAFTAAGEPAGGPIAKVGCCRSRSAVTQRGTQHGHASDVSVSLISHSLSSLSAQTAQPLHVSAAARTLVWVAPRGRGAKQPKRAQVGVRHAPRYNPSFLRKVAITAVSQPQCLQTRCGCRERGKSSARIGQAGP